MLTLLLIATTILNFNIRTSKVEATITIKADGRIDPSNAPISTMDNATYALEEDINDSIIVERDNITINGKNYKVQGTNNGIGILLRFRNNVTLHNIEIVAFEYGLRVFYSKNISLQDFLIKNNDFGILIEYSTNVTLRNNVLLNNRYNFGVEGTLSSHFDNFIDQTNIADGKPICYVKNVSHLTLSPPTSAATLYIINSMNVTVKNLQLTKNFAGIYLFNTNASRIENTTVTNNWCGISLLNSLNNTIKDCVITHNNQFGIDLHYSTYNNLTKNLILNNNKYGIQLRQCHSNRLFENIVMNNQLYGIMMLYACHNIIYHNSFVNNTMSKMIEPIYCFSIWDDGYPSGGNYWSDHKFIDNFHGPNQDMPGSDGLCDTPYTTSKISRDRYPLMKPWVILSGDLNLDRKVTLEDLVLLAKAYNSTLTSIYWNPLADLAFPYGKITLADLVTAAYNYGQCYP
jgi:parallel beta-helix repeat protein